MTEITAMRTETPRLNGAAARLQAQLHGALLAPGQPGYDAARSVWNAMIDRQPELIAQCTTAEDVVAAVAFAREHGLLLSIKGGGHNVAGRAVGDGGLMLDLSRMKGIAVDPAARTARVEPGVLWEELDAATQAHGLATVGGVVGSTGVAGLTLGGGQGWLTGKHGLSLDNLLAVEVVTADGARRRASAAEEPDFFWAMRGAGTNFGVATAFEFQLHPVSTVLGGLVIHQLERGRDVLRFYGEFAPAQPDELTTYAAALTLPDGAPAVALVACWAGEMAEGEHVLAPLRGFGRPLADTIAPIPYLQMQGTIGPGFPHGRRNYWKSGLTDAIPDELIETIVDAAGRVPSPHTAVVIADCHGAYRRLPNAATAYAHRNLQFDLVILSSWIDAADDNANIAWTREFFAAAEPHLGNGVYVNDLDGDDGEARVRAAYGGNYERLARLKARYDPANLFRQNTNILPRCED